MLDLALKGFVNQHQQQTSQQILTELLPGTELRTLLRLVLAKRTDNWALLELNGSLTIALFFHTHDFYHIFQ